ncbi:MAG: PspC domain-containing protein [Defluviitaleaceae bacterium]|nr:PspC domain-containing protein [Defluviitaleaceae bacterium]
MEKKKLKKSSNKVLAGVCAGIAEHFDINPLIVRIVTCVLLGLGVTCYIIMFFVMANPDGTGGVDVDVKNDDDASNGSNPNDASE